MMMEMKITQAHLLQQAVYERLRGPALVGMLLAICLTCTVGSVSAQSAAFILNPKYEALIDEARQLGVDPLDLSLERKLPESTILDLDRYLNDKLKTQAAKLDAEAKEREARIAKLNAQSLAATKGILAAMKSLDAQGRMSPKAVADLNWLFNNGSEEERALIRRELGKYLKP